MGKMLKKLGNTVVIDASGNDPNAKKIIALRKSNKMRMIDGFMSIPLS